MTEQEWLESNDPQPMLDFLREGSESKRLLFAGTRIWRLRHCLPDRRRLLFAAASFRRLGYLLPDPRQQQGIEMLEEIAEGTATMATRREVTSDVRRALPANNFVPGNIPTDDPHFVALMLYRAIVSSSPAEHAWLAPGGLADGTPEQRAQSCLLRCIFGNPFRPVVFDPLWRTANVTAIAQTIYEERRFADMPILADALEEAGCTSAEILDHCRQPAEHVRGCWAVDLVLAKE